MNDSDSIPEETALEIFALAARLHEENNRGYSLSELQQIAAEAGISPECVERAVRETQSRQISQDDCQKTAKPQVPWLKGIHATTSGLLLFLCLAPILWDISHTFYLAISRDIDPDNNLEQLQQKNSDLKKTFILNNLKREEIRRMKAQIEALQTQIDAAERSYDIYVASLPQQTSRWNQSQKVKNNRLVANLNGLQAERYRLIIELRQQKTASPQAVNFEIENFIKQLKQLN
ncbi:MAG: hypothetical protein CLLPBCKN_007260 [Chroococcidiopsis cubana SAG 39.79]|uniref:Uncharacterized protein n=1 Tax=Chroococcidiopsis cubana SAG 39.79 TaxID=388085 RepID=A0AB37URU0_9CYAN|nr:hypothetical protein [Chroococcidiopsis cubana]MDZ4877825.1 hypothetical protein [Chroococcidiopsis cubana SAG 39.79]PSB66263.1 hypothetical protein C7B79_01810 [Chroococcidiopsis cubana CCALA 043]RUT14102.1 hypothetical protein DSM107010_05850 [Chroococcidiopsis cubana SAG 39.79]